MRNLIHTTLAIFAVVVGSLALIRDMIYSAAAGTTHSQTVTIVICALIFFNVMIAIYHAKMYFKE